MNKKRCFTANNTNWKPLKDTVPESIKYLNIRSNQLEVYNDFINTKYAIIRQPPGAGKSATIKFNFAQKLNNDPNLKIIISIPQNIIHSSFLSDTLIYKDGTSLEWQIDPMNDLSVGNYESKVDEIIKFLNKKKFPTGIHERIMICSHAGLVLAYKKANKISWKNTVVVIDEAHHIQGSGEDELTLNGLGTVVKSILKSKSKSSWLWFTTATYFRGDGVSILSSNDYEKFETYFLPLDKYFETLRYIKTYSYDFIPYQGEFPQNEIKELLKNKKNQKKTIIYVPCVGRLWAEDCKKKTVAKLKRVIHKVWKEAKILDLVDEEGRDKRKKKLLDNKYSSDIDVVLAVNLLDEGTDWPEAQQVLDLSPSSSLRIAMQRFGRLLRDRKGKKHLSYYVFFQFALDFNDVENCRKRLNENFAALSASFMIEESIVPVRLPANRRRIENEDRETREPRYNYFKDIVKDEIERGEIRQEILEGLIRIRAEAEEVVSREDCRDVIKTVLSQYEVIQNVEEITDEIEIELSKRAIPNLGTDISWLTDAGFDKIRWEKINNYICQFVSGRCGKGVLKEIREYWEGQCKTSEEWVKIAEELALANHEGRLEEYEIA